MSVEHIAQRVSDKARGIDDPTRRAAFLAEACGSNVRLRAEVEWLLSSGPVEAGVPTAASRSSPDAETLEATSAAGAARSEQPGTLIGNYKLLQQIGTGGFGVVYLAAQEKPVRRRVALKIIKLGMDTKQVVARFEAERQALAMMDHPNIAKVLDGGATEAGRPFFVMELVKGVPITDYCDNQNLSLNERLELFMQVCGAVQHAHQKGIIHRDLKPSNILVTHLDDKPVPKVIDFGIAKATEQPLTDQTMFTQLGQFIGTPAYMSPEQTDPHVLDVDTRSDIYALGVVLYALLTGTTPFGIETLRGVAMDEIKRIIREDEPARPSMRLSTLGEQLPTVARQRGVEPRKLGGILRGDLDWIILKALAKDRTRRYQTANDFARDIERYLNDEPVLAGPPQWSYRLRKFARRHRALLGTAASVALALVIGLAAATYGLIVAHHERDAKDTARLEALAALDREKLAREEAEAVTAFLVDMLQAVDPDQAGKDVPVSAVLAEAARRVDTQFKDQPLVEARLRHTIAATYINLGRDADALPHALLARSLRERELGQSHQDSLGAASQVAHVHLIQGRYDEAATLLEETLHRCRAALPPDHPATLGVLYELAYTRMRQGRFADAEALTVESRDAWLRTAGPWSREAATSTGLLGWLYLEMGHFDKAEPLLEQTVQLAREVFGPGRKTTSVATQNLAVLYSKLARHDEAEALYQQALDASRAALGPDHPEVLNTMHSMATLYWRRGDLDQAIAAYEQVLDGRRRVLGSEHPDTLLTMYSLALMYKQQGRLEKAEALWRETLAIQQRTLGPGHDDCLRTMSGLATALVALERYDEAETLLVDAVAGRKALLGADHPHTLSTVANLAGLYVRQQRFAEAEPLALAVYEGNAAHFGDAHPSTIKAATALVQLYESWDAAEPDHGHARKAATWRQLQGS